MVVVVSLSRIRNFLCCYVSADICIIASGCWYDSGLGSVLGFRRRRTTVNPMDPQATTVLLTDGFYRISRNPMYLGVLLLLVAFAVALGNPVSVIPVVFFVLYITIFQIKPEERILAENFGDTFSVYSGKVRRWI